MHTWYHYSLDDMPSYGIFYGWCVHGKFPCPVCKATRRFIWLVKGVRYSAFDNHRQFLPLDHPFRQDKKNFTKGVVVEDPPPQMMTAEESLCQLEALKFDEKEGSFKGYG